MSRLGTDWAFSQELPPMQKLVLLALANRHNSETGRCDPSLARLAKDCSLGKTTVQRALAGLCERRLVTRTQRKAEGVFASTTYALQIGVGSERTNPLGSERTNGGCTADQGVGSERTINQEDEPGKEPKEENSRLKGEKRSDVSTKQFDLPEIPDGIPAEPWTEYVTMRKEIRKPLTPTAAKRLALKIEKLRVEGNDPALLLNKATERQWQSVFPGDDTKALPPKLEYVELSPEEAAAQWERDFGRAGSV